MKIHKQWLSIQEADIDSLAKEIFEALNIIRNEKHEIPLICLTGDLGAGKTRLARAITEIFGIDPDVSSPTFNLMNQYNFVEKNIYHFDLYRIHNIEEISELGFEEIWNNPDSFCIIEWWNKAFPIFTKSSVEIKIDYQVNMDERNYFFNYPIESEMKKDSKE